MSKAFYQPSAIPKLLRSFPQKRAKNRQSCATTSSLRLKNSIPTIEVWNTTCIVTNFGKKRPGGNCSVLINPANSQLSGVSKFPYFPRGGPVPEKYPKKDAHHIMGYVSSWGGMEVGSGMMYAFNVVDGIVHQLGGWRLAMECKMKRCLPGKDEKCPVGKAVITSPGGSELRKEYDSLVHTVPPFYDHDEDPQLKLRMCYRESFGAAFFQTQQTDDCAAATAPVRVACPLLGSGARGFPLDVAVRIAAEESVRWRENVEEEEAWVLAYGIPEQTTGEFLVHAIEHAEEQIMYRD